jgi:pentatricopeptide repeat protein
MYAKCSKFEDAQRVFDKLEAPDEVSWGVMIAACAKHGHEDCALALHESMRQNRILPTESTLLWVLKACGDKGVVKQGRMLHCHIVECGLDSDMCIVNSTLDMYAKCGSAEETFHLFDRMPSRDAMSWGIMISAALLSDDRRETFEVLVDQKQLEGFDADDSILTSVLGACRQVGLIREGVNCFNSMHNTAPTAEQYGCLADLLGRIGCLEMAADVIQTMPVREDVLMWTALLHSCKMHGNNDLADRCLQHVLRLDPDDTSGYVLIASMYSEPGNSKSDSACKEKLSLEKRSCFSRRDRTFHGDRDQYPKLGARDSVPIQPICVEIGSCRDSIAAHCDQDPSLQHCCETASIWSMKNQEMCFHNSWSFQDCFLCLHCACLSSVKELNTKTTQSFVCTIFWNGPSCRF